VDNVFDDTRQTGEQLRLMLAMSGNNWPNVQKLSVSGEKSLARLASGFVFLLANPKFYLHVASGYPHPCISAELYYMWSSVFIYHIAKRVSLSTVLSSFIVCIYNKEQHSNENKYFLSNVYDLLDVSHF
jgi:hypothetical protein